MSVLTAHNLTKYYGPDEIFSNLSLEIPPRARVALVGPNGAGKTTLINILTGREIATEGDVHVARSVRIGYLPQRPELAGDHTLREEALTAFANILMMEQRLSELEAAMAEPDRHDAAIKEYGPLQEQFELIGGYTYESRLKMVLQGVGFEEDDFNMRLPHLSGGQKTRALLARLLLEEPDLLVLDEPTNHLDIYAVEWLEGYLKDFPGAILAVSHDRYFMDNFATTIWEMEYGLIEVYRGNYSHYVRQRDERHERHIKEYESQQEFLTKEQDYIRKHMGSRWTAQAKGRLKKLETMKKRGKIITRPRGERKEMNLRLQAAIRSGDKVLMTEALTIGYDPSEPLLSVPDITLFRGETAALIGPNGVGKTTFLKTVIEQLEPLHGEVRIGASVVVGYFAQAHEKLDPYKTLLDEIYTIQPMKEGQARNYLARYLFTGEDVFRTVSTLSGGERGRLALAKLSLAGANLLLLDEPTNHLDIDSQEVLQEVLAEFAGTILLVSHDRYLIDALATQIWAAQPGDMQVFNSTYREYLTLRNKSKAEIEASRSQSNGKQAAEKSPAKKKHGLNDFELKKRLAEVEAQIHALEQKMDDLTGAIAAASANGDAQKVSDLGEDYNETEAELENTLEEWELLME